MAKKTPYKYKHLLLTCNFQVRGFSIEYLAKVPEVKDTVHKHSILHHLCTMILEQYPDSTDLYSDIGPLTRCSRVRQFSESDTILVLQRLMMLGSFNCISLFNCLCVVLRTLFNFLSISDSYWLKINFSERWKAKNHSYQIMVRDFFSYRKIKIIWNKVIFEVLFLPHHGIMCSWWALVIEIGSSYILSSVLLVSSTWWQVHHLNWYKSLIFLELAHFSSVKSSYYRCCKYTGYWLVNCFEIIRLTGMS